ncbi:MAG TPA: VirB8/TrbF family protein [Lysobacter sp.]
MVRKKSSQKIDGAIERSVNYEITVADLARRSERRAWTVAFGAILMSLILAGGYFYMLPMKEKVPYLIMADAYTGSATVARLRGDFNINSIAASEAVNRANVATFLRARESYDWNLIGQRDWGTVFTMAEPSVASVYRALYSTRNPEGPLQIYGKKHAIRIRILSLQLFGGDAKKGPSGATVRFQRSLFDKSSGASRYLDSRIATLEFKYKPNLAMSEEDRLLNPLGFRVSDYRVDNDYSAAPSIGDDTVDVANPTVPLVPAPQVPAMDSLPARGPDDGAAPMVPPVTVPGAAPGATQAGAPIGTEAAPGGAE